MFRFLLFSFLIIQAAYASADEGADYLRGYVDAILDSQYSELELEVERVRNDGRIRLLASRCISVDERLAVRKALLSTGRFRQVKWTLPTAACKEETESVVTADNGKEVKSLLSDVKVAPLPVDELFRPLIADPRQPQFSIKYHAYDSPSGDFNAASVSFGDYFGFVEGFFGGSGFSQLGLQGAVFAVFNLDSDSFDLVNADYWIGFPLSYRKGPWSFLGRIYHQSSHLGDEFLLGNVGINRINLSYEDFEILGSYDYEGWRIYGGAGYILHSEPDLDPWHAQLGLEYRRPAFIRELDLIAAVDYQADQDTGWDLHRSYQVGFGFEGPLDREIRLMLEYYNGRSPNGQFWREELRYVGLGVYFDL